MFTITQRMVTTMAMLAATAGAAMAQSVDPAQVAAEAAAANKAGLVARGEMGAPEPRPTLAGVAAAFDAGLYWMLGLSALALCLMLGQILYLRYLIVRPIRVISGIFNEIARDEGDFSRDLPLTTHDELRELAVGYNRFAAKMREIIGKVRTMSVGIAREAVQVKLGIERSAQDARRQGEMTQTVFEASTSLDRCDRRGLRQRARD